MLKNIIQFFVCPVTGQKYTVSVMKEEGEWVQCSGNAWHSPAWFTNRWIKKTDIQEVDMGGVCCCDSLP